MRFCKRIDAKGFLMDEYEDVQGLIEENKLVYNFQEMHDFKMGLIRGVNDDNRSHRMPRSEQTIDESLDQQAYEENIEIRRKIAFMLSTVSELMNDGLISDFSILESSLEQVFKNLVTKHAATKNRDAGRNVSEESGDSQASE
jgi:hypothetical protein